jgi:hypothetical protein
MTKGPQCALLSDGSVWCWGDNYLGGAGQPEAVDIQWSPARVPGLPPVKKLGSGMYAFHMCAILMDDTLVCWGRNDSGQLGIGTIDDVHHDVPLEVKHADDTVFGDTRDVHAGESSTCAVKQDSTVWCWGGDNAGQLGDGLQDALRMISTPATVQQPWGGDTIDLLGSKLAVGERHACSTSGSGLGAVVSCWGDNYAGTCGQATGTYTLLGTEAGGVTGVDGSMPKPVASGNVANCAITGPTHIAKCWGSNQNGVLGRGASDYNDHPDAIEVCTNAVADCSSTLNYLTSVLKISMGETHACALVSGPTVRCWGDNDYGQLGTRDYTSDYTADAQIDMGDETQNIIDVETAPYTTCVVLEDRTLRCFGLKRYGAIGAGQTVDYVQFEPVSPWWVIP